MVVLRILCHSAQRPLCHCEEQRDVAISRKGNIVNNMVVFIKLSKGHSCYNITSAIIKNKCIKVR